MCGVAAWMQFRIPMTLTSNTRRQSSASCSANGVGGAGIPALAKRMSSLPNRSTVSSVITRTAAWSETSTGAATAMPPAAVISSATR
jgi:hypothetical protein